MPKSQTANPRKSKKPATKPAPRPGGAPLPFLIQVDTREKKPYEFVGHKTIVVGLRTGDYGIGEYYGEVAIERKSWSDFYGCLAKGRGRFEDELARLSRIPHSHVVIEADFDDLAAWFIRKAPGGRRVLSKVPPAVAIGSIISWSNKFRVPIWLCGDRKRAEWWTVKLLSDAWRQLERDRKLRDKEAKQWGT